jgi:CRP-like cAMP-binding protein
MSVTLPMTSISQFYFTTQPVLDSLPEYDLKIFREHLKLKRVRKGKELFREGSFPKAIYIIKRGKVKLFQRGQSGTETIVYIYSAGEMFGFRPTLSNEKHPAGAVTMEESGIYVLPVKHFIRILSQSAALSNVLLRNLSHEFTVLINRIGAFAQRSVKERTALSLLILREKYRKHGEKDNVEITLSRADLAAFVGTTVETIARIVSKWKEEKVIRSMGRRIVIEDEDALYKLVD